MKSLINYEKLCIVNCLQSYLEKRNHLVNDVVREFLTTYGKPHKPVFMSLSRKVDQKRINECRC